MPCFIKLGIIGQIGLGDQSQQLAAHHHRRAVVKRCAAAHRQADEQHCVESGRFFQNMIQRAFCALQQRLGKKEIPAGIPRQPQFRKNNDRSAFIRSAACQRDGLFCVICTVGYAQRGRSRGDAHKTVFHGWKSPLQQGFQIALMVVDSGGEVKSGFLKRSSAS